MSRGNDTCEPGRRKHKRKNTHKKKPVFLFCASARIAHVNQSSSQTAKEFKL